MTFLPRSGRTGYMIWNGNEIPIYMWSGSVSQERTTYRTSYSLNFPVRRSGPFEETFYIRGVEYIPAFNVSRFTNQIQFELGWIDLDTGTRQKIPIYAQMNQFKLDYYYYFGASPSFCWTAQMSGYFNKKEIISSSLLPFADVIRCANSTCSRNITTTDVTLNGGFVEHVYSASIIDSIERMEYETSYSNNYKVVYAGEFDMIVDLRIHGDFDYWLDKVNDYDDIQDYKFFYGAGVNDYWDAPNMKLLSISNIVTNIQTAEIVSADIQLGAAYG